MRFPEFADEWKQTTLGEIAEVNPTTTKSLPLRFQYIDLESVEKGRIVKNNVLTREDAPSRAQRILNNGDVIFQMVRPYQQNNLYFNLKGNIPVVASTGYAQLRGFQSSLFLYYAVHTPNFLGEVLNRCTGSNYPAINSADLSTISLSLPSLAEQEKIASFLSLIDERIQSCSETIKERKREKAALLNQLFSQKLRFPQFSDEWQQTMLGEIAEILNSRRKPITSSDRVRGDYPYYGASGIIDYVNEYIFDEQLLLIGEDGAKWGKDEKTAFIVSGRCWVNNHAHVLRFQNYPTYKLIEAFFFSLNLKPFVTGDAPPKLTLENLKSILIHFPSLAEQEKIADFLSLIDERIEVEEELLEQYERQKRYLLKQMFI
ncbi:restriction endonuclease subunit S [Porphyromonas gingivalis]|uniref:restriction endonuclease subunit S n=1 Tax=Porphyromonas gingivalis TaxID=837 RepID=UPI000975007D|nr:restriction endonuclease subunit S [Porphyromonas gingivalis]PDP62552.1 restriction endonuclease subunit S [Porphyromonas gingivalis]SJL24214.1 Type I restriction modification DNA specificity domain protein [Porphyromonas gingivalis]